MGIKELEEIIVKYVEGVSDFKLFYSKGDRYFEMKYDISNPFYIVDTSNHWYKKLALEIQGLFSDKIYNIQAYGYYEMGDLIMKILITDVSKSDKIKDIDEVENTNKAMIYNEREYSTNASWMHDYIYQHMNSLNE